MPQWQFWVVIATLLSGGVGYHLVNGGKEKLQSIATEDDLKGLKQELHGEMATIDDKVDQAVQTAETAQHQAKQNSEALASLIESNNEFDEPILERHERMIREVREGIQDIREEQERQARVETEQAFNFGRLLNILDDEGYDVDDEELKEEFHDRYSDGGFPRPDE